jgi:diacylglycerol kinase (ATP)
VNRTLREAFRAAGCGLDQALRTQRNLRIQCAAAAGVLLASAALGVSAVEVAVLAVACGLVLGLELVNTAVELVADALWPYPSEVARRVKDTAAAAVVVAAAAAAAAGAAVLGPPLLSRLGLAGGWVKPAAALVGAAAALAAAAWRWVRRAPAPVEDAGRPVVQ